MRGGKVTTLQFGKRGRERREVEGKILCHHFAGKLASRQWRKRQGKGGLGRNFLQFREMTRESKGPLLFL